jgi:hypothetical protein
MPAWYVMASEEANGTWDLGRLPASGPKKFFTDRYAACAAYLNRYVDQLAGQ